MKWSFTKKRFKPLEIYAEGSGLKFNLNIFLKVFLLLALALPGVVPALWANPFEQLTPDQSLYQRVKKLGDYGLLDPQDKAVLDEGKVVTRLELAFYTEKAKARIEAPQLGQPQLAVPTPTPQPPQELMTLPPPVQATPTPVPVIAPPAPPVSPALRSEVDDLLKQLKQESAYLKTRLSLDDQRIKAQEKELEALQNAQDDVNAVWKKANRTSGAPNFNTKARFRFENLFMSGITIVNATRTVNEVDLGMWTDLGGKGAISLGLEGLLTDANATDAAQAPVSVIIYNPDVNFGFDGPLGHWDTHFTVEAYPGAGTLGDFTRGIGATSLKRYQNPVDMKHFSDDKDQKTWDDYISNISVVPPSTAGGAIVSSFDPVFDGIYGVGTNLPLIGSDARMVAMFGRYGGDTPQRWEEALKVSKPMGPLQTEFSTEWINDNFGLNTVPRLDLKSYEANFYLDLSPFTIDFEVGLSHLYSGLNNGTPVNYALEAPAGQASISYYPFSIFYTAISDGYANFASKVVMASTNFTQYGVWKTSKYNASDFEDAYGLVGEVDNLVSNRYGWRVNLGWDGRKQDWMKGLPSFLDDIVINFDVAQKTEYRAVYSPMGYNVVEAFNILSPFYQEDEGIWGLDLWGGYAASPWLPARQAYDNNIQAFRNDGNTTGDNTRYQFTLSSERIPLILPVANEPVQSVNNQPTTVSAGTNTYVTLSHLKSYNYITLTTKYQFNKMMGFDNPLYGSFFFTDNRVSGKATDPTQSDISNLFDQTVFDFGLMFQPIHNINLMGEYGWEAWKSSYTWPLVDYRTTVIGGGLAYDIPWGGGKIELRYKDINFQDAYVPANSYHTGQWLSEIYFLF